MKKYSSLYIIITLFVLETGFEIANIPVLPQAEAGLWKQVKKCINRICGRSSPNNNNNNNNNNAPVNQQELPIQPQGPYQSLANLRNDHGGDYSAAGLRDNGIYNSASLAERLDAHDAAKAAGYEHGNMASVADATATTSIANTSTHNHINNNNSPTSFGAPASSGGAARDTKMGTSAESAAAKEAAETETAAVEETQAVMSELKNVLSNKNNNNNRK